MNRIPIMNVLIMNDLSSNNMNKDTHDIDARGNGARGGNSAAAETGRDADGRGVVSAVAAREDADDAGSGEALREAVGGEYKYGFVSDIDTDIIPQGLNADIVRLISQKKGEPDWLLEFRLKAFRHWQTMKEPKWGHVHVPEIDYQAISYYADPLAKKKNENKEIEQVRNKSTRNAIFLTVLFIFGGMLYRVAQGDLLSVDSSSFLIFLILNVLCLEFGIKKATVDRLFKRNGR